MLKIGLSSYSLSRASEMDIVSALRFAAENGAEHMEIVPGSFAELKDMKAPGLVEKIVTTAKECNLELSSYTIGANFVQPDAAALNAEIERVKGEVEIAAKLGVTRMRHDCAWRPHEECSYANFEKELEIFADACGQIADKAKPYGITSVWS